MACVSNKVDSNIVGLRLAEEECPGILKEDAVPPTGISEWLPYEPNSFDEFGSDIRTRARNTINADRSRLKGSVVGEDAVGGFQMDFTQESIFPLMQGFMFADWILKAQQPSGGTSATSFLLASTVGLAAGDLVKTDGFANESNNVFDEIVTVVASTSIDLLALAAPVIEGASADATSPRLAGASLLGTSASTWAL